LKCLQLFARLPAPVTRLSLFPYTTLFRSVPTSSCREPSGKRPDSMMRLTTANPAFCPRVLCKRPDSMMRLTTATVRYAVWLAGRSEEHTSELHSRFDLVYRLLRENKHDHH